MSQSGGGLGQNDYLSRVPCRYIIAHAEFGVDGTKVLEWRVLWKTFYGMSRYVHVFHFCSILEVTSMILGDCIHLNELYI